MMTKIKALIKGLFVQPEKEKIVAEAESAFEKREKRIEKMIATLNGEDDWFLCKCEDAKEEDKVCKERALQS